MLRSIFIRIFSFLLSIVSLIAWETRNPTFPDRYKRIDLSKFTQTFSDEFDGELDTSVWTCPGYIKEHTSSERRGSYWNSDLAYTENGNLVIPIKYLENGMGGKGAGWYTAELETSKSFSQTYGYFEVRCILPKGADIWSAFWLMNNDVGKVDGSGQDGTEVDIYESPFYGKKPFNNVVYCNLHYDGYGAEHKGKQVAWVYVKGNPYEEYNTYGLEWNENEYIFYLNGMEYARSDFGGVCQNPLYMLLSVEMQGADAVPSGRENSANPDLESDYIIDYVRVYQYNDKL